MTDFDFDVVETETTGNVFDNCQTIEEVEAEYNAQEATLQEELNEEYISYEEMNETLNILSVAMTERIYTITTDGLSEEN